MESLRLPRDMQIAIVSNLKYTEIINLSNTGGIKDDISEAAFRDKLSQNFPESFPKHIYRKAYYDLISKIHIKSVRLILPRQALYMFVTDKYFILCTRSKIRVIEKQTLKVIMNHPHKMSSLHGYLGGYLYFIVNNEIVRLNIETGEYRRGDVSNTIRNVFVMHDKLYAYDMTHIFQLSINLDIIKKKSYAATDGRIMEYHDAFMIITDKFIYTFDQDLNNTNSIAVPAGMTVLLALREYFIMSDGATLFVYKVIDNTLTKISKNTTNHDVYTHWALWGNIMIASGYGSIALFTIRNNDLVVIAGDDINGEDFINGDFRTDNLIVQGNAAYIFDSEMSMILCIELSQHLNELV